MPAQKYTHGSGRGLVRARAAAYLAEATGRLGGDLAGRPRGGRARAHSFVAIAIRVSMIDGLGALVCGGGECFRETHMYFMSTSRASLPPSEA